MINSQNRRKSAFADPMVGLWRLAFLAMVVGAVYLSWKPSPAIIEVRWIPVVVGQWFDEHDFTKNLIGYGTLAFTGFMAWAQRRERSAIAKRPRWPISLTDTKLLVSFCLLVVALELGQLALPRRTCDWADVLAGWTGILLA